MGEMMKGNIFLRGRSSNDQLRIIYECLGTPSNEDIKIMKVDEEKKAILNNDEDMLNAMLVGNIKKKMILIHISIFFHMILIKN